MNRDQDVIEAAKTVVKLWRDIGIAHPNMNTALALLSRSVNRLKLYREGKREEEAYYG